MQLGPYRFDRFELAGSLGDLGTLIPLSIALVTVAGMEFTPLFLAAGVFYVATGLFFRLPVPVQPLKLVAAIAIASPERITPSILAATGIVFGTLLLILGFSGVIDRLAKLFTKPIIRGIQLGLGFVLVAKGVDLIAAPRLFSGGSEFAPRLAGIPVNLLFGLAGAAIALFLFSNRRLPAALVIVGLGLLSGLFFGPIRELSWTFGPGELAFHAPALDDCTTALFLLVLPQLPLTLGNAVIGSTDAARQLFGSDACAGRVNNRNYALSMGVANLMAGSLGAMPMCHGAGGLAGHYRFGARTGGATIMLGIGLAAIALLLGDSGLELLSSIPNAILGVLLFFAGLELALLVRDVDEKADLFVTLSIAGIAVATRNMGLAFATGIAISWIIRAGRVRF
jgi:sulfate permease, SulP family